MGISSTLDKDFKSKGKKSLSSFKKIKISKQTLIEYKKDFKALSHIRDNCDGYLYLDNNKCIAVVAVENKGDYNFIQAIEIAKEYQGYGLSKQLLSVATKELKAKKLSVNKKNAVAIDIYKKYGFKTYDETENMLFMNINESFDPLKEVCNELQIDLSDNKNIICEEYDLYNIAQDFNCKSDSELDEKINAAREFNNHTVGKVIIFPTQDGTELDSLYSKFMALGVDSKAASDNKAKEIFGKTNREIYTFIRDNLIKTKNDEVDCNHKPEEEPKETSSIFSNDSPLLTPEELIDKVNENYSCFIESEAESIKRWRQEYALMGMGIKTENYNKYNLERINILRKAIYENNNDAIIQCGWIPGIEFNSENRVKASSIIREKMNINNIIDYDLIEESSNSIKLYHLSENNLDKKTLQPKVPSNFLTKNGYEDKVTKRICFSTSINGCLRGLSQNLTNKEFYVHVPDKEYSIYKPTIKEVPDSKITNEVWIKDSVKLKCIGRIKVHKDSGEDGIPYKYGNNTAELYDWDWSWINKINESYIEESSDNKDKKAVSLVFVAGSSGLAKTIRKVQGTEFSHASISLDDDLSKIYSFNMRNGFDGLTYESVQNYIKEGVTKMGVYTFLVSEKIYKNLEKALDNFSLYIDKTKYSILNLLTIPLNISLDMDMKMVCSEFVDKLLKTADLDLTNKKSSLVGPKDLIKAANTKSNIVEVYNGDPKKFKHSDAKKRIQKIKRSNLPIYEFVEDNESYIEEAKSFPIQFDNDGNLILKSISRINFEQEYADSHRLLKEYEKTKSYEPMKFELAKMQFFITLLEKRIYKNGKAKSVDELKVRARFINDFKKYLKIVNTNEPDFNFTGYYEQSPFNDALIKINKSTLKFGFEALKYIIK